MKFFRLALPICALLLAIVATTQAQQVPQAFNYQGIARDAAGVPMVNSDLTVQFRILRTGSTSPVYVESHNTSTNEFGLFTLPVGSGTPVSGTFGAIDWTSGAMQLGVSIDIGAGPVDLGTSPLLSVPYALAAGSVSGDIRLNDLADVSAGGASTGQALVFDGTSWVAGSTATALSLPYADTLSSDELTPILALRQTGSGSILRLQHAGTISTLPALRIQTSGIGAGIHSTATGTGGTAGLFDITNASSTVPALQAVTSGVGNAASFVINNATSDSAAVRAFTNGTGAGVYGESSANGVAYGVYGIALGECVIDQTGVRRFCPAGVYGEARRGPGVYGYNRDLGPAVQGYSVNGKIFLGLGPSDVNAFPDTEFFVDNGGNTYARGDFRTPQTYYSTRMATATRFTAGDTGIAAGDVIAVTQNGSFVQSSEASQVTVVGVAVANAAVMTGISFDVDGMPTNLASGSALAVSGIVTINVNDEGGAIVPGDLLVSSSTPGEAMKAPEDPAPGTVVAKALGSFSAVGNGSIQAIIMMR